MSCESRLLVAWLLMPFFLVVVVRRRVWLIFDWIVVLEIELDADMIVRVLYWILAGILQF